MGGLTISAAVRASCRDGVAVVLCTTCPHLCSMWVKHTFGPHELPYLNFIDIFAELVNKGIARYGRTTTRLAFGRWQIVWRGASQGSAVTQCSGIGQCGYTSQCRNNVAKDLWEVFKKAEKTAWIQGHSPWECWKAYSLWDMARLKIPRQVRGVGFEK